MKPVTMLVLIALLLAFIAAAAFGGIGAAVAPDFHFGLIKSVICARDAKLEYEEGQTLPYEDTEGYVSNRTEVFISCITKDGKRSEDKAFQAIIAVIGFYFLVFLAPAFLISNLIVKKRFSSY